MSPSWKWCTAIVLGVALTAFLSVRTMHDPPTEGYGGPRLANPDKGKVNKSRVRRQSDPSLGPLPSGPSSKAPPNSPEDKPWPEPGGARPAEEMDRESEQSVAGAEVDYGPPEVYVEEEGDTWTAEIAMEAAAQVWRPVVILPPGVTAEFEDSPDDAPLSLDNPGRRRVTRSTVRANGANGRGRR